MCQHFCKENADVTNILSFCHCSAIPEVIGLQIKASFWLRVWKVLVYGGFGLVVRQQMAME